MKDALIHDKCNTNGCVLSISPSQKTQSSKDPKKRQRASEEIERAAEAAESVSEVVRMALEVSGTCSEGKQWQ